jgi:hypothetical protein
MCWKLENGIHSSTLIPIRPFDMKQKLGGTDFFNLADRNLTGLDKNSLHWVFVQKNGHRGVVHAMSSDPPRLSVLIDLVQLKVHNVPHHVGDLLIKG